MSRTIRRTSDKARYPRFEKQYTHTQPETWEGMTLHWSNKAAFPLLPLEGKAFKKAYHKYHSDNGFPSFGFENAFERPMRVTAHQRRNLQKQELHKWRKNPDYEIIDVRDKLVWDYC
jgi:hypothetical protein